MSAHVARWVLSVLAAVCLGGVTLVDEDFDTNNPWFFVGLTIIIVSTIAANATLREYRTRTLNEEFEAGYRVGYRAGRRNPLRVAQPTGRTPPRPIPLRPKRSSKTNEAAWPESDDSPPGSTRLQ